MSESKQPPYVKTSEGERIHLVNNGNASDPTWYQLKDFLFGDETDRKTYNLLSFPCGAFAEQVHNNAEVAGIRAAWVAVHFQDDSEGHALNAFNTIDRGLVYMDCTGSDILNLVPLTPSPVDEQETIGDPESWDKISYIEIGREYCIISLKVATSPSFSYYEQWKERLLVYEASLEEFNSRVDSYNLEVEKYNQWVNGKILHEGSSETLYATQWSQEFTARKNALKAIRVQLEKESDNLGTFWEPLGIVKSVEIYW